MKTLRTLYKEHSKLSEQISNLVQAKIVKFCDDNNYDFNTLVFSRTIKFESEHGNEIQNKKTDRILKLINEHIDYIGHWDGQFHYSPAQYAGKGKGMFKAYNKQYMAILNNLKRIAKKL